MAKWVLLNRTQVANHVYPPAKLFDDATYPVARVRSAGGFLMPATDANVAFALTLARALHGQRGGDEQALTNLLLAGYLNTLAAGTGGVGYANATVGLSGSTTLLVNPMGWYLGDTSTASVTFVLPPGTDGAVVVFQVAKGQGQVVVESQDGSGNFAPLLGDPNTNSAATIFTISGLYSSKQFAWNAFYGLWL